MYSIETYDETNFVQFVAWVEKLWPGSGVQNWPRTGVIGTVSGQWACAFGYGLINEDTALVAGTYDKSIDLSHQLEAMKLMERHLFEEGYNTIMARIRKGDKYVATTISPIIFGPAVRETERFIEFELTKETWEQVWGEPY